MVQWTKTGKGGFFVDLQELCRAIQLPPEVCRAVLSVREFPPEETLQALTRPQTAAEAWGQLAKQGKTKAHGLDMLAWLLRAALYTRAEYERRGIDEGVYLDTMKCFSRFVGEHKASYGRYGFDRGFWVYRQLSLTLFRLGELEYEWVQDGRAVSLHVPSDADISLLCCRQSLARFDEFARAFFPKNQPRPIGIDSWLLSPVLGELLPPDSKINRFRTCFRLTRWDQENTGFMQWIFGRNDIPTEELPETTTLQKKVKARLLQGQPVGTGCGVLEGFDEP